MKSPSDRKVVFVGLAPVHVMPMRTWPEGLMYWDSVPGVARLVRTTSLVLPTVDVFSVTQLLEPHCQTRTTCEQLNALPVLIR